VYATLEGLKQMQRATDVAKRRSRDLKDLAIPAQLKDASLYEPRQPQIDIEYHPEESPIGFEKSQKATVAALGLRKVGPWSCAPPTIVFVAWSSK
jgi:hypothetical protein